MTTFSNNINPKRILISGYYGFGNTGDEAILCSMIYQIMEKIPECIFTVVSENPDETKRLHSIDAIYRLDYAKISQEIERSDLVILGGGGLFQDHYGIELSALFAKPGFGLTRYAEVPLLAKMHGKPLMFYSQGFGPLFSKEAKTFVSFVCSLADVITTRDEDSKNLLEEIGVEIKKIIVSIDPAFEIPIVNKENVREILEQENIPLNERLVCVSVRQWVDKSLEDKYIEILTNVLDDFLKIRNVNLLFIPFQDYDKNDNDSTISARIIEKIGQKERCYLLSKVYHPREIAGIISKSSLVIGMRLHSIIFAARSNIPVVALSYDPKVQNHMKDLKLEDCCFDLFNGDTGKLIEILNKAWDNKEEIKTDLEVTVNKLKNRDFSPAIVHSFLGGPHSQVLEAHLQNKLLEKYNIQKLNETIYRQAELLAFVQKQYQQYSNNKEMYIQQLKDQVGVREKLILDLQTKILDLQTKYQDIIMQKENSISGKITRIYNRIFRNNITAIFRKFADKVLVARKIIEIIANERIGDSIKRVKSKLTTQFTPITFNPYNKLRMLKPVEVIAINKDYSDKINDIKGKVKFSMVVPVKNEEKDILDLLKSIQTQSLQPDEVIIVDGGSTDNTINLIKQYKNNSKLNLKLIEIFSNSVSQQRNAGIKSSKYDSIILTDTVILPSNFCLNFMGPLVEFKAVDLVAGIVQPQKDNYWARKLIWDFSQIEFNEYIPPGASMLIKKQLALKFNGFPEFIRYTGEDTLFDVNYRKQSKKWVVNTRAIAYWDAPDSEEKALKKAYLYGRGDGENGVGDFRFYYEPMINVLKGNNVEFGDPVTEAFFKGYVEGRKNRVKFLVERNELKGNILILSGVPFSDSGGGQRGTQLALEFMKYNHKVTFCNYYPSHETGETVFLDIEYQCLELYHFPDFQIKDYLERHESILDKTTVILELPHPDFIPVIEKLKSVYPGISVIYDCIDNWDSSLGGNWYSKEKELEIIGLSNIIMASAKTLADRVRTLTDKEVHLMPNAVNTRLFDPSINYARPKDLPSVSPIAMYTGALWGEWFDWELLKNLANGMRDVNFVMIGNIPEENPKYKELKDYNNLFFLGLKNQYELPGYLSHANVCIIPFKFDEKIIKYTNPLKVYEYLAMGKPVVSTNMNELEGIPFVYLSKDYNGFIENLKSAFNMNVIYGDLNKFIYDNSWINRVDELIRIIN